MGLKLEQLPDHLRRRILAQMLHDDAEAAGAQREDHARPARLPPANQEQGKGTALVPLRQGKTTRHKGDGNRYNITFTVYAVRPADYDGLDIKWLQDRIVDAGWLPNDDWQTLEGTVRSRKCKTGEERTEVEITRK